MRFDRPCRIRFARALPAGVCAAAAALLLGCSGNNFAPPGTPVLSMGSPTNSSDFAAYLISVDSITLTATDGSVETPLVTPELIDFAKLNSITELVEVPAVPSGTFTSATITLDYSAPAIWLNPGSPVLASPVTNTGAALTVETVTVTFDPNHPLVITAGKSVRLHIDFDLTASNSVTSTSTPTVQVQPFVTMTAAPVDSTVMRARGLFVTVPTGSNVPAGTSNAFIMNMRPFFDLTSALGALNVNTNANTYWNINGTAYTGTAGLSALSSQMENIPIVAYGKLDDLSGITPSFNATSVYVGTSQESPLAEHFTGVVSARSGDTLTLRGVTYLQPLGQTCYLDSAPVTVGSGTIVSQDGVAAANLTAASISVGQQISVSGQVNPIGNVDTGTCSLSDLDATAGQVRLAPTPLWGTPTAVTPGSVTLDVLSLGAFAPGIFAFTGTGASGQDATPTAYAVNTGSLDTSAITAGTPLPVLATGIVSPFGSAPPDFTAAAIMPGASTLQTLVVEWKTPGAVAPFTSTPTSAGLVVNLADANLGSIHQIRTGPTAVDLNTLPAGLLITTVGADQSNLDLAVGSTSLTTGISVFNSASAFASGLNSALAANKVFRLVAYGQYNRSSNTFVASRIRVALEET